MSLLHTDWQLRVKQMEMKWHVSTFLTWEGTYRWQDVVITSKIKVKRFLSVASIFISFCSYSCPCCCLRAYVLSFSHSCEKAKVRATVCWFRLIVARIIPANGPWSTCPSSPAQIFLWSRFDSLPSALCVYTYFRHRRKGCYIMICLPYCPLKMKHSLYLWREYV